MITFLTQKSQIYNWESSENFLCVKDVLKIDMYYKFIIKYMYITYYDNK